MCEVETKTEVSFIIKQGLEISLYNILMPQVAAVKTDLFPSPFKDHLLLSKPFLFILPQSKDKILQMFLSKKAKKDVEVAKITQNVAGIPEPGPDCHMKVRVPPKKGLVYVWQTPPPNHPLPSGAYVNLQWGFLSPGPASKPIGTL